MTTGTTGSVTLQILSTQKYSELEKSYQVSVIKLCHRSILEYVLPLRRQCEEIAWNPSICHHRPSVVYKSCIEPGHECSCTNQFNQKKQI